MVGTSFLDERSLATFETGKSSSMNRFKDSWRSVSCEHTTMMDSGLLWIRLRISSNYMICWQGGIHLAKFGISLRSDFSLSRLYLGAI